MGLIKKYRGLLIILTVYLLGFLAIYVWILKTNDGVFTYILDDTYIHLSVAERLAFHGTFGIETGVFTSASSSPAWTVLLSILILIFGSNVYIPLYLNILLASGLIVCLYFMLRIKFNDISSAAITAFIILASPIYNLTFIAMEHILQCLGAAVFVSLVYGYFIGKKERNVYYLTLMSLFIPMFRYEMCFLVGAFAITLLFTRKYWKALLVAASGILPVMLFGLYSVAHNNLFFPNSLILKGGISENTGLIYIFKKYFYSIYSKLGENPHTLIIILIFALLMVYINKRDKTFSDVLRFISFLLLMFVFHCQFSAIVSVYRYDAYLVITGLAGIALVFDFGLFEKIRLYIRSRTSKVLAILLMLAISAPFLNRIFESVYKIPLAARNIYTQQYQMSKIIGKLGNNAVVAVNDIGLVTFYNNNKFIDLWGLANTEIAKARLSNHYDRKYIDELLYKNGVDYVIIYDSWYRQSLNFGNKWLYSANLLISNNVTCGDDNVSFYSKDEERREKLIDIIEELRGSIPSRIMVFK